MSKPMIKFCLSRCPSQPRRSFRADQVGYGQVRSGQVCARQPRVMQVAVRQNRDLRLRADNRLGAVRSASTRRFIQHVDPDTLMDAVRFLVN